MIINIKTKSGERSSVSVDDYIFMLLTRALNDQEQSLEFIRAVSPEVSHHRSQHVQKKILELIVRPELIQTEQHAQAPLPLRDNHGRFMPRTRGKKSERATV